MNMDNYEDDSNPMSCFCQGMCPHGIEYGSCETKPGGKCFTSVELEIGDDGKEHPVLSYGCLPPNEMALFQCGSTLIAQKDKKNIKCCDEYDFCNKHLLPIVEITDNPEIDYFHGMTITVLLSSMAICLVVFITTLVLTSLKIKRKLKERKKAAGQDIELPVIEIAQEEIDTLPQKVNAVAANNNESDGGPEIRSELVQRTIAQQITFELMIAAGKFSQVWKAKWRGERVAVKIYQKKDEKNWIKEIEIFQTPLLRHESILGYIAADSKDNGPNSGMYIITEYHSHGSLRSYLQHHTVNQQELFQMIKGLASALNHLHTEIIGSNKKPCIAHNNINSTNILVKKDKECCFSDFSKAVRFTSSHNHLNTPTNTENADIRYLAPEFLNNTYNMNSIDCFKMGDIYSFALIIWEILNRCEIADSQYRLPFEEELADDECCLENLIELVVNQKIRPKIKSEWQQDPLLSIVVKIMMESWNSTPSVRLTSLRIKKTIFKIQMGNVIK